MKRRHFLSAASAAAAAAALPSCRSSSSTEKTNGTRTLTIFTWVDYLSDQARESFEKAHNAKVVIDTFDSNESMLAKLEVGAAAYDIVVPSSYAVAALHRKKLLQNLNHQLLPNLSHIDTDYLTKALDPRMEYSVPYLIGPTCIAYLDSRVPNAEPSWNLFDRSDLKGRITLLDDMREVIGAALKSLGHSLNSTNPSELAAAREVVLRWTANIAKFENEQYKTGIVSGEFDLVHGYAGDLIQVSEENPDMRIIVPREGSSIPCDDLCIPANAKEVDLAHAFINHLCDPAVSAENMEYLGYRAPNRSAYNQLSEDFRGSPVLFPPAELFAKCEPIGDLGDQLALWTAEWDKIKAGA